MFTDDEIVQLIQSMIKPEYLIGTNIFLRKNKSDYNSIVVKSQKTAYRCLDTDDILFARIWGLNNPPQISFKSKYENLFDSAKIKYSNAKNEPKYLRVNLDTFSPFSEGYKKLPYILNKIFIDLFSFPPFGCCSKYVACSDAKHCLHEDLAYSTACQYRANLEQGKIFYGKNKNI